MLRRLLSRDQEMLLQAERDLLQQVSTGLARLEASKDDQARLDQARRQLDELFLLVIVGEFNAGKSAFINALLGQRLLDEGATPTTTRVHILRHGDQVTRTLQEADLEVITCPVEWLSEINLVDTPGTNAVILRHQEITQDFVPRSDLVLFVTSADRPFSESERTFMDNIRTWGKKVVIVVNKIDLLEPSDVNKVRSFVTENAVKLLGVEPQIFLVSAKLAQRAKAANQQGKNQQIDKPADTPIALPTHQPGNLPPHQSTNLPIYQPTSQPTVLELWSESRFEPLERYILDTLDQTERLRLKLLSPLGVASRLREKYADVARTRLEILGDDFTTLDTVETDLQAYEEDMRRDFSYRLGQIDAVLLQMSDRGVSFIDEWLRITRVFDLANGAKVREAFERDVIADTPMQIERQINDLIDWMVDREYKQWLAIMGFLNRRADLHKDRVIGEVGGAFEANRREFLETVRRATQRAVSTFDQKAESAKLADSVQSALAQTAILEAGALGIGAILVAALHTVFLDVTGLLFAGTLAALGLYVLPNKRRKAREDLRNSVAELQARLHHSLTEQFEQEQARSLQRIREAIQPYTRFVRTEREKLTAITEELDRADGEMRNLRARIEAL